MTTFSNAVEPNRPADAACRDAIAISDRAKLQIGSQASKTKIKLQGSKPNFFESFDDFLSKPSAGVIFGDS
jgi:hypothetical protein